METDTSKSKKTRLESDADLSARLDRLDFAPKDEPQSWAAIVWRIYQGIPGTPRKILAVVLGAGAVAAAQHWGLW